MPAGGFSSTTNYAKSIKYQRTIVTLLAIREESFSKIQLKYAQISPTFKTFLQRQSSGYLLGPSFKVELHTVLRGTIHISQINP
jgi:hypothetical protein